MQFLKRAAILSCLIAATVPVSAQQPAPVTISRLEAGTQAAPIDVNIRFSDTMAYKNLMLPFVFSSYLIKHGDDYMLWDTGHAATAGAVAPKVSLTEQLAKGAIKPEQIKFIGISHFHSDHIGGAAAFPGATLLIGKGDWDVITRPAPPANLNPALLAPWITGSGKVEPIETDKDVFGDGSVVIINTPGHTPGHHALLVELTKFGPVILSGDAVHFRENGEGSSVPFFNFDRSQTLASVGRIKALMTNIGAKLVIQRDARDVGICRHFQPWRIDLIPAVPGAEQRGHHCHPVRGAEICDSADYSRRRHRTAKHGISIESLN